MTRAHEHGMGSRWIEFVGLGRGWNVINDHRGRPRAGAPLFEERA